MRFKTLATVAALMMALAGCGGSDDAPPETTAPPAPKIQVVASTTQLTDFARTIGGEHIDVHGLVEPNMDPHHYQLTPTDITAIAKADVLFKNGAGLDTWFDEGLENSEYRGVVVDTSVGVTLRRPENAAKQTDPHIWHSPLNAKIMVSHITRALVAADPAHKDDFQGNERAYDAQIDALATETRQEISALPSKKLVTQHYSMGYYADEYGLEYTGFVLPFNFSVQPTAQEMADLAAKTKAEGVKAVFAESWMSPRLADALAKQAGVNLVSGTNALYGDSLGVKGSDGETFLKAERHNTSVIVHYLR